MTNNDFNKYMVNCQNFSGKMNVMANSIDLIISFILEDLGYELGRKTLGAKINLFEKKESQLLSSYSGDLNLLIAKLNRFNKNWNVTKHGMVVGGSRYITFSKDGTLFEFNPNTIIEIDEEFTEIMKGINEIFNGLKKGNDP